MILMLASGVQAATVVIVETDFMRGTETRIFPFEIVEGGLLKATLTDFEFPAPMDARPCHFEREGVVEDLL